MKNKKVLIWLTFIIIFGVVIFLSSSLLHSKKSLNDENDENDVKHYSLQFEKIDLAEITSEYTENGKYDIELLKSVDKNIIYGTVYDSFSNGDLFLTKGVYTYDFSNNKFNYYENIEKNRIIDFCINENILYKVIIEYNNDDISFRWKIKSYNLLTKEQKTLKEGTIIDKFKYPILYLYKNNVYVSAINDYSKIGNAYTKEKYTFYKINNNSMDELIDYDGSISEDKGDFVYNVYNAKIFNNKFYYTIAPEDNLQYLVAYDLDNKEKINIRYNKLENYILYNYVPSSKGIYINYANRNIDEKSMVEYIDGENIRNLETELNTFENLINEDNLLFHNIGNIWALYNIKENKIINLNETDINMYPKYLVIDENKIVTQDFENNFYIGILEE